MNDLESVREAIKIEGLRRVIHDQYGYHTTYLLSVPVREPADGDVSWQGMVRVFKISFHITGADRIYAWSYNETNGKETYAVIIGIPPIDTAVDAVKAHLASLQEKSEL